MELDSRRLGGSALLIPFSDDTLASTTYRHMLKQVLDEHLIQPDLLANAENQARSIQPARDIICGQWKECVWDKKSLKIEAPAIDDAASLLLMQLFFIIMMFVVVVVVIDVGISDDDFVVVAVDVGDVVVDVVF